MSNLVLRYLLALGMLLLNVSVIVPSSQAQTCTANIPHIEGEWRTLPYLMPINPISATLLHTGQVLIVAGSENDAKNNSKGAESYRNALWDPTGATQSSITVQNIDYDVFCSGTAALPDGRALVIGGTSDYFGGSDLSFKGDNRASIFDPATGRFVQSQSMVDGRWYATATTLSDGRIIAFSGLNETNGGTTNTVEIYDLRNAGAGWTSPMAAPFTPPLYPRLFQLPNGKVFYTGQGFDYSPGNAWFFDPLSRSWAQSVATTRDRHNGSAVLLPLLPPSYTPKVMNFGGGDPATSTTEIIDLSAATLSWTPGPNMSTGRIQMNAVLLPNGKVLAEGGSLNNESPQPQGRQADLYDPVTNTFSSAGVAAYSRLYHSVALLLPDATVMSAGSNPPPRGDYGPTIEIYRPAYLFDANDHLIPISNRPSITGVPGVIGYGASFSVTYTSTSAISAAVLVRPGSATHAFDMEQRLIGLCGPAPQPPCNGAGTLNLTSPSDSNIAPPCYYMLFLLDSAGVPSIAKFIQLTPYKTSPPRGAIASPNADMTIQAGGSVYFSTISTAAKYSWVFPSGSPATSTAQIPGNVTFNTPGTYVVSLTVIDSAGNSDFSPPTRTITVLPSSPDFSIAVSPSSQAVTPGQSTTFTVTVTSLSGFTGAVSLSVGSESGFPSGISSGGFSPSSITGAGTATLTMNTTTSATPYALSLTITGATGALTHTASTTLLVNLAAPASLTVTPGNAQVALSWPASVGATGYEVKRALFSGGPYTTVGCTNTTAYTDTGVRNGTTYYYVVSATYTAGKNGGGASPDSSEARATPQGSGKGRSLTGSYATPVSPVNLSTEGTADWAHWGFTTPSSFNHKAGVTPQISNITQLGSGTLNRLADNPTAFSWTGGTPTASATTTPTGIWVLGKGNGFQFTVPADTTLRTLRIYVGLYAAQGQLQATLNDGSAPDYLDTSFTNTSATSNRVYTLSYKAAASGKTLTVRYTVLNPYNSYGNVTLEAATLAGGGGGGGGDTTPPTAPTGLTATAISASQINLSWTASTDNVGVTGYRVERCQGVGCANFAQIATPTGTSYTDTGLAASTSYSYRVRATDAAGNLSGYSSSVSATTGSGSGSLTGSYATPVSPVNLSTEGTADWAHWGFTTPSSFNHKAGVTPQISNITQLGSGTLNRLADNPTAFSWTGGTPTASATTTPTGIWVLGKGNGFQFTAPADTTLRTLRIYVGLWAAQGQLQATLSDGSAPAYLDTSFSNTSATSNRVYTLGYKAAASGKTLTVRYTVLNSYDAYGNVTLEAATLK